MAVLRGTVALMVRALAFSARGPLDRHLHRAKKYHHVTTDWLCVLCALAKHFTLICLGHLRALGRYRSWENITI